jgi:hypothetical protein
MPAPLSKPSDGLRLYNSFTGIVHRAPTSEVVMVGLVVPLPIVCQLLRAVGSLVCAGEVGDELLLKVYPTIDTALWQIIQPYPGWPFKYLWHTAHRPSEVSPGNVHSCCIIFQPVFWLGAVIVYSCATCKLEVLWCRFSHNSGSRAQQNWSSLPCHHLCQIYLVKLIVG